MGGMSCNSPTLTLWQAIQWKPELGLTVVVLLLPSFTTTHIIITPKLLLFLSSSPVVFPVLSARPVLPLSLASLFSSRFYFFFIFTYCIIYYYHFQQYQSRVFFYVSKCIWIPLNCTSKPETHRTNDPEMCGQPLNSFTIHHTNQAITSIGIGFDVI